MTALSADLDVNRKEGGMQSFPVAASTTIYKGAIVAIDGDGYLVPAADTDTFTVVGIAYEQKDNSSGLDAALNCRVYTRGVFLLVATSIAQTSVGNTMYAADDQTVDESSTHDVPVGILVEYVSATSGWVEIGKVPSREQMALDAISGDQIDDDAIDSEHYAADSIDKEHLAAEVYTIEHLPFSSEGSANQTIKFSKVWSDCTVVRVVYFTDQALGTSLGIDILDGGAAGAGTDVIDSCSDNLSGEDANDLSTPYALSAGDWICVKLDNVTASTLITADIQLKVPLGTAA